MKFEPPKYLDEKTKQKGRLAIGLMIAILAMFNFWSVLQNGELYWSSSRWDWLERLLTQLVGPFGPATFLFIISLSLIIPSIRYLLDQRK